MNNLMKYLEEKVEGKRMLTEATETESVKEIFQLYSTTLENLSDAFSDMSNKANIDGNGKVPEDMRKVEVAVTKIKQKTKTISNSKEKIKFDEKTKKAIGEIKSSLLTLKDKIDNVIIPIFEIEPEPEFNPDEEDIGNEEDIVP